MKSLTLEEVKEVQGGIGNTLGTIVFSLAAGLVTGGPVGFGIAACGVVGAKGIDNLNEMYHKQVSETHHDNH